MSQPETERRSDRLKKVGRSESNMVSPPGFKPGSSRPQREVLTPIL